MMDTDELHKRMQYVNTRKILAHDEGIPALQRLMVMARRDTGQSCRVAKFLLGLYNGHRFKFDLTDFRGLDAEVFDDCIKVLKMDADPRKEVCDYFDNGNLFEQLAEDWGLGGRNPGQSLDRS
jgi:hypothetical protein